MNRTNDLRIALREAADVLTCLTIESTALAESALDRALACARDITSQPIDPQEWPAEELALCRQLATTANLFWEARRLAAPMNTGLSQSWVA